MSLRKRDFQLFMKRLRKKYSDDRIRFYACGEYGSETFRPHYHAILFGLHLDDLELYKSKDSYKYFTSPGLQRVWSVLELGKDGITPLAPPKTCEKQEKIRKNCRFSAPKITLVDLW